MCRLFGLHAGLHAIDATFDKQPIAAWQDEEFSTVPPTI
jgi:hypothetical protein